MSQIKKLRLEILNFEIIHSDWLTHDLQHQIIILYRSN